MTTAEKVAAGLAAWCVLSVVFALLWSRLPMYGDEGW